MTDVVLLSRNRPSRPAEGLYVRSAATPLKVVLIPLLAMCLSPIRLAAQAVPSIAVGARVRVSTAVVRKLIGFVESWTPDTLVLLPEGQSTSVSIPVSDLKRIDISRGTSSRKESALRYAKRGAVISAAAGAVSLGLLHEEVSGGSSVPTAAALGAWSGGLFGGLIGALIGVGRTGEKWERIR